jgi:hypothetical protein
MVEDGQIVQGQHRRDRERPAGQGQQRRPEEIDVAARQPAWQERSAQITPSGRLPLTAMPRPELWRGERLAVGERDQLEPPRSASWRRSESV